MSATLAAWLPWVQTLGWTLLHFVWQGLVVGIGFAAVRALIPKTHCNARYAAGLASLGLLTLWPLATLLALRPHLTDGAVIELPAQSGAMVADLADAASSAALAPIDHLLPLLVLLWGVGVLVVAARALQQWRALARVAREWAQSSEELDALLAGLTRRFGFMRRIRVLVSTRIDTPILIGWLKPVVLLPTAVALGFPRQQVELILAHELGHLRRYDHLVNLAQALIETLLFYHPVVHWISREVRNERELCCDALVLRLTTGEPREYARTLAALEELRQPSAQLALGASGGVLVERVRRIVGMPAPGMGVDRPNPVRWLLLAGLFTVVLAMTMRVERAGETRFVGGLTVDWLSQPDVRVLPIAALTLPFKRPHLRLAEVMVPAEVALAAPVGPPRVATVATAAIASGGNAKSHIVTPIEAVPAPPAPAIAASPAPVAQAPARLPVTESRAAAAVAASPVATHIVTPSFPSYAHNESGRVEASFLIDAEGAVRDIRIADTGAGDAFARAAERALRQWRFAPATVPADRSRRYQQSFLFAPRAAGRVEGPCVQSTGTLICRSPEDSRPITTLAADTYR